MVLFFLKFNNYLFFWGGIFESARGGRNCADKSNAVRNAGGSRAMRGGRLYFLWFCTQRPPPFAQTYYSRYARAHTPLISHNHTHIIAYLSFCLVRHTQFWPPYFLTEMRGVDSALQFAVSYHNFVYFFLLSIRVESWSILNWYFYNNVGGEGRGDEVGGSSASFFCTVGCICFTIGADHQPVRKPYTASSYVATQACESRIDY